jgi:NADH-quinone oxidoreductase subunit J
MQQTVFYILSALSVATALLVVLARRPVHSVLCLIACFFTIAGHYLLLNAQFLFAVHIIVYAGAILVLFLFVIMLLNLNVQTEPVKPLLARVAAVTAAGLLLVVLVAAVRGAEPAAPGAAAQQIGTVKRVGLALYNDYLLPFEVSALLFLTAMVGAVKLGKKEAATETH